MTLPVRIARASLLALLLLCAQRALARPLTLGEVFASVERSFPQLRVAQLDAELAEAELLSAQGAFDVSWKTKAGVLPVGYYDSLRVETMLEAPTELWGTTAFAGWRLGRGGFPSYEGKLQTLDYGELRAGVNVPLWRNGPTDRRRTSLGRAELGREIAELGVQGQRIEVLRTAATRYWTWVAAGQRLQIAQQLLRLAQDRDAAVAERVERGDLPAYERTDNARAIAQRRAQLAQAERGLVQAALELGLLLRDERGNPLTPGPEQLPAALPEPAGTPGTVATDLALAAERRVEIRRFQLQGKSLELEQAFTKNQLAPVIDLQLAGSADLGPKLASRPDLSQPVLEVSLLLELPLQTRALRGRAQAASLQRVRTDLQLAYARDTVQAEVRDAHAAVRAAAERVDAAREELGLSSTLEEGERIRFDHGDSTLLTVFIREQQTAEARLREVDALLDYQRARLALSVARGEAPQPEP